jgi:predicted Zn-dependent protease
VESQFSREEEREADLLGFYNVMRAHWTPMGMLTFFSRLQQFTGDPGLIAALTSAHPPTAERVEAIKNEMKTAGMGANLEENSVKFQAMKLGLKVLPSPVRAPERP